jgi:quinoprotein glucose dehydrogenase
MADRIAGAGEYPELAAQGQGNTGSENYGGPIVTAGGVVFIGATIYDHRLRAFDAASGALLWRLALPLAGTATPATYVARGRQYLVIETNNDRNPVAKQGCAYVAFRLP